MKQSKDWTVEKITSKVVTWPRANVAGIEGSENIARIGNIAEIGNIAGIGNKTRIGNRAGLRNSTNWW